MPQFGRGLAGPPIRAPSSSADFAASTPDEQNPGSMGDALASSVTYAVGIAASPIPVVAVIVLLLSPRPRVNSILFTVTWVAGISAIVVVTSIVPGLSSDPDSRGAARSIFRIAVGIVFVGLAVRNWRRRPAPGEEPSTPAWLRVDAGLGTRGAVGLGLVLSFLNPKDLALAAAGGAAIGAEGLSAGRSGVAIAAFTAVAVSTVVVPVAIYVAVGARSADTFDRVKNWLLLRNAVVLAVIWLVLGVAFVLEGATALR